MNRREALLLLVGVILTAACKKNDVAAEPVWGKEPCAHCAMIVGEQRYAAQVVVDGERYFFDDAGCMVRWLEEKRPSSPRAWVHDAESARWLDARVARYVAGAKTPMDYGFEAHERDGATFDEMRARVLARSKT